MFPAEYEARREDLALFALGLTAFYEGRFVEGESLFAPLAEKDPAARAYLEKCRALVMQPPEAWQGVWVVTTK
jgi:hypothetical protein